MDKNPLFPDDTPSNTSQPTQDGGYILPGKPTTIQPPSESQQPVYSQNPAANLIREKLNRLYATEPDALAEEREAEVVKPRSKHQEFMYSLSTSGKSLADIQTEWHNYYVNLPDAEKHQVWQEFYENNVPREQTPPREPAQPVQSKAREVLTNRPKRHENGMVVADHTPQAPKVPVDHRSPADIRSVLRQKVAQQADKLSPGMRQNIHSLAFGLATGLIVLVIFLFGFFNEVIIAPFIQPGRASATPIIVSNSNIDADGTPEIIIPKINVEIPVIYNVSSSDESVIENALEDGVVHYPTTVEPGQQGNAAFFGHSSNNIFNKGKYKFAFVLLHKLQKGDIFYLTRNGVVYSYKVFDRKIVSPSQVDVLNDIPGQTATATLITCDPPGTSLNRLVVVGEQVSPNPAANDAATNRAQTTVSDDNTQLPGNGPTLWTRLWRSIL